jgi:hypothetical protein
MCIDRTTQGTQTETFALHVIGEEIL